MAEPKTPPIYHSDSETTTTRTEFREPIPRALSFPFDASYETIHNLAEFLAAEDAADLASLPLSLESSVTVDQHEVQSSVVPRSLSITEQDRNQSDPVKHRVITRSRAARYTHLNDLLKSGILRVGERINLKGHEGLVMREGWIEYGDSRYPGAWTWCNAIAQQVGSSQFSLPLTEASLDTQNEEQLGWQDTVTTDGQTLLNYAQLFQREERMRKRIEQLKQQQLVRIRRERIRRERRRLGIIESEDLFDSEPADTEDELFKRPISRLPKTRQQLLINESEPDSQLLPSLSLDDADYLPPPPPQLKTVGRKRAKSPSSPKTRSPKKPKKDTDPVQETDFTTWVKTRKSIPNPSVTTSHELNDVPDDVEMQESEPVPPSPSPPQVTQIPQAIVRLESYAPVAESDGFFGSVDTQDKNLIADLVDMEVSEDQSVPTPTTIAIPPVPVVRSSKEKESQEWLDRKSRKSLSRDSDPINTLPASPPKSPNSPTNQSVTPSEKRISPPTSPVASPPPPNSPPQVEISSSPQKSTRSKDFNSVGSSSAPVRNNSSSRTEFTSQPSKNHAAPTSRETLAEKWQKRKTSTNFSPEPISDHQTPSPSPPQSIPDPPVVQTVSASPPQKNTPVSSLIPTPTPTKSQTPSTVNVIPDDDVIAVVHPPMRTLAEQWESRRQNRPKIKKEKSPSGRKTVVMVQSSPPDRQAATKEAEQKEQERLRREAEHLVQQKQLEEKKERERLRLEQEERVRQEQQRLKEKQQQLLQQHEQRRKQEDERRRLMHQKELEQSQAERKKQEENIKQREQALLRKQQQLEQERLDNQRNIQELQRKEAERQKLEELAQNERKKHEEFIKQREQEVLRKQQELEHLRIQEEERFRAQLELLQKQQQELELRQEVAARQQQKASTPSSNSPTSSPLSKEEQQQKSWLEQQQKLRRHRFVEQQRQEEQERLQKQAELSQKLDLLHVESPTSSNLISEEESELPMSYIDMRLEDHEATLQQHVITDSQEILASQSELKPPTNQDSEEESVEESSPEKEFKEDSLPPHQPSRKDPNFFKEEREDSSQSDLNEPCVDHSTTSSTSAAQHPVILASGLSAMMLGRIQMLVQELGGNLVNDWNHRVTHLVVLTSGKKSSLCRRTIKFNLAVLSGISIVSYDWILDSFHARKWVVTKPYQVRGDETSKVLGAPETSRQARAQNKPRLFHGLKFYFYGEFQSIPKDALRTMVSAGGAKSFSSLPPCPKNTMEELAISKDYDKWMVICDGSCLDYESAKELYFSTGFQPISFEYLFDCVSHYKLLPPLAYQILDSSLGVMQSQASLAY